MKSLFTYLSLTVLFQYTNGQEYVKLRLKFEGQSPIVYKVTMKPENIDSVQMSLPLNANVNDSFAVKVKKGGDEMMIDMLKRQMKEEDYCVIKKINDNKFLVAFTNTDTSNDLLSISNKFDAYIDNLGNNLSFYLSDGVNIITRLFFGLPERKVTVGDTWQTGLDMTSFNGVVKCDTSFKKDIVKVISIKSENNDTLVELKYDFQEYFKGIFYIIPTTSNIQYYGTAIFSVNHGLWIRYDCIKQIQMTGWMNSKSKEIYRLEPISDYPKIILKDVP